MTDDSGAGEAVATSQRRWRAGHDELTDRRFELGHAAATGYPDLTIVDSTDLMVPRRWLAPEPIPLDQIRLEWRPDAPYDGVTGREEFTAQLRPLRSHDQRYATYADAIGDLTAPPVFENRTLYRLLDADLTSGREMAFGRGRYFDTINVGHAVGHEYATQGPGPLRAAIGDPTDTSRRCVGLAISTLTLRVDSRTGDATFLLHWRDPAKVAHAGGLYQVVPSGMFQPSSDAGWNESNDFDLWRNMFREFNEELLGAAEDYGSDERPIDYDLLPHFTRLGDGRRDGSVRAYALAIGVDALTLATDLLTVAVFEAAVFDEVFGALVEHNEEGRLVSSSTIGIPFTAPNVDRFVGDEPTQAAGAAALSLAWKHRRALRG